MDGTFVQELEDLSPDEVGRNAASASVAASLVSEVENPLLMDSRGLEVHGYKPMFATETFDGTSTETADADVELQPPRRLLQPATSRAWSASADSSWPGTGDRPELALDLRQ